jgi:hypothetical protein
MRPDPSLRLDAVEARLKLARENVEDAEAHLRKLRASLEEE